ncbi:MAG: 16S rRNA (cytosine(1402)-N(4))-methyltransferase RsmH [Planctomycetota bacterium]|nr:MAG: 16S rRNA (cytosine(1402)-N(4))-methyltransferase RsmH [Planctomycetota bacterium]
MPREVLAALDPRPGHVVLDGTVGAGGHARLLLSRIGPQGLLIGIDRDPAMVSLAARVLDAPNVWLLTGSYARADGLIDRLAAEDSRFAFAWTQHEAAVDCALLDLGWSSDQLADAGRGFAFDASGTLDMRYSVEVGPAAWELLETATQEEIADWLRRYGEERYADRIAAEIVRRRGEKPIRRADELARLVIDALPQSVVVRARRHPATRVFQALRIRVNRELEELQQGLNQTLPRLVRPGGRLAVISFHSLEDRYVKKAFSGPWWRALGKPVTPTATEVQVNPRSRSAKLRVAERTSRMPEPPAEECAEQ